MVWLPLSSSHWSVHYIDKCWQTHLDGSSSKVGELFDVLALLADQSSNCLSWNKEVDNLLFWSLLLKKKKTHEKSTWPHRKRCFTTLHSTLLLTVANMNALKTEQRQTFKTLDLTCQLLEEQPRTMTPHASKAKLSSLRGFALWVNIPLWLRLNGIFPIRANGCPVFSFFLAW